MGYIGVFIVVAIIAVGFFLFVYSSGEDEGIQAQLEAGESAVEEAQRIKEILEDRPHDITNQ